MFLKNKNIIFKIRRSKVTDYAALKFSLSLFWPQGDNLNKLGRGALGDDTYQISKL